MLFYVPAARADPLLFTIVLAGLVATLNAALVTLAFVTICDVALGSTGVDRARAMRNFAKVSAPVCLSIVRLRLIYHHLHFDLPLFATAPPVPASIRVGACGAAMQTAAARAGDGSLFTELSVLMAVPEAATRWYVLSPHLIAALLLPSLLPSFLRVLHHSWL